MKKLFAIIALALAALAPPALAAELRAVLPGGVVITAHSTPCEVQQVLAFIDPAYHKLWFQARVDFPDIKGMPACWAMARGEPGTGEPDYVLVVDAIGNSGFIEPALFKPVPPGVSVDR